MLATRRQLNQPQSTIFLESGGFKYFAYSYVLSELPTNPTWKVFRTNNSTGALTRANGNRLYNNLADNLPSLTYS